MLLNTLWAPFLAALSQNNVRGYRSVVNGCDQVPPETVQADLGRELDETKRQLADCRQRIETLVGVVEKLKARRDTWMARAQEFQSRMERAELEAMRLTTSRQHVADLVTRQEARIKELSSPPPEEIVSILKAADQVIRALGDDPEKVFLRVGMDGRKYTMELEPGDHNRAAWETLVRSLHRLRQVLFGGGK